MHGRFLIRPVLTTTAVLGVVGTAVLAADTDSLSRAQLDAIFVAFNEWEDEFHTNVDALDADTFTKVQAAFDGDMAPPLTFAVAKTVDDTAE